MKEYKIDRQSFLKGAGILGLAAAGGAMSPVNALAATPDEENCFRSDDSVVIDIHPEQKNGTVNPRLFGGIPRWYELMEGAYTADGKVHDSFFEIVKTMGFTEIRYGDASPLSASFIWKDSIGPLDQRPKTWVRRNAKGEKCVFGMDEFGQLCEMLDATGTMVYCYERGNAKDAAQLAAYLTLESNDVPLTQLDPENDYQYWANLRKMNGHAEPYPIVTIDIGNEIGATSCWFGGKLVERGAEWTSEKKSRLGTDVPNQGIGLYCFGGTVRLDDMNVIGYPDLDSSCCISKGTPHQEFYAAYAPVRVDAENPIEVHLRAAANAESYEVWTPVASFDAQSSAAKVFVLEDASTGRIRFGDGMHGAIPPKDSVISMTYTSGHHDGFVDYYREIKKVNPNIQVDLEFSVGMGLSDQVIAAPSAIEGMGDQYPYDRVDHHPLMTGWPKTKFTVDQKDEYLRQMMLSPRYQYEYEAKLLEKVRKISGRNDPNDMPLTIKAFGHGQGDVMPGDAGSHQSLMDGMLRASEILAWAKLGIEDADLFVLNDDPYYGDLSIIGKPPRFNAAIVRGNAEGSFVAAPIGLSYQITSMLAGKDLVVSSIQGNPQIECAEDAYYPTLDQLAMAAASDDAGNLDIVVVNQSANTACTAAIKLNGYAHDATAQILQLNGPSAEAKNTPENPEVCTVTERTLKVGTGSFRYEFPAHSVTGIHLTAAKGIFSKSVATMQDLFF